MGKVRYLAVNIRHGSGPVVSTTAESQVDGVVIMWYGVSSIGARNYSYATKSGRFWDVCYIIGDWLRKTLKAV